MNTKQQNLVNKKVSGDVANYTKEFKEQVIAVYNSGAYATIAECARSYKIPDKLFYQWLSTSKKTSIASRVGS